MRGDIHEGDSRDSTSIVNKAVRLGSPLERFAGASIPHGEL
jgi:hypothetical protein